MMQSNKVDVILLRKLILFTFAGLPFASEGPYASCILAFLFPWTVVTCKECAHKARHSRQYYRLCQNIRHESR